MTTTCFQSSFLFSRLVHSPEVTTVHDNGSSFTNLTTDGKNMALTASTDGIVRLWDARNAHMPIASTVAHEA